MTNEVTIRTEGAIDYSKPQVLKVIRDTVAIGASESEFAMFIQVCKSSGLNPFKREIWFIKAGGRVQMMTGINGFTAIANNSEAFDGVEVGLVGKAGEYLPLTYPGNDFIGAWAKVHRKDRKFPSEGVAMLAEYDKGQGNWKSMKRVMITKCAESIALRKAFPQQMNGLYTQEEMPAEYSELRRVERVEVIPPTTPQPKPQAAPAPKEPEIVFEDDDDLPAEWLGEAQHYATEDAQADKVGQVAFQLDGEQTWYLDIPYKLSQDETFKQARKGVLKWNPQVKRWTYTGTSLPTLEASDGKVDLLQFVDEAL